MPLLKIGFWWRSSRKLRKQTQAYSIVIWRHIKTYLQYMTIKVQMYMRLSDKLCSPRAQPLVIVDTPTITKGWAQWEHNLLDKCVGTKRFLFFSLVEIVFSIFNSILCSHPLPPPSNSLPLLVLLFLFCALIFFYQPGARCFVFIKKKKLILLSFFKVYSLYLRMEEKCDVGSLLDKPCHKKRLYKTNWNQKITWS